MLFWITRTVSNLYHFQDNIIYSVTFRSMISFFFALCISLGTGYNIIHWLNKLHCFQSIRLNGPTSHLLKKGTPTMGGIIMLVSVITSIIIWSDLSNLYVWYVLFILVTYGALGMVDDLLKIKRKDNLGLNALNKYAWQSLIALILVIIIFISKLYHTNNQLDILLFKNVISKLNMWDIILAYFVIVSTSNAVNLSDGLDGLAIVPMILITIGLALVSWVSSSLHLSNYFHLLYICESKELIVICASIIGSGLGFLWFNAYPARIFMGDMGSLSFGGAIGVIAVLLHQEYLLLIMGGLFVVESLSVILQVIFFKIFKKRIFKMAPVHHHFELTGSPEPKIVVRCWIISSILVLLGLITLNIG